MRHYQDTVPGAEQGEVCEEEAEAHRTQWSHAEGMLCDRLIPPSPACHPTDHSAGSGAVDTMLRFGSGGHSVCPGPIHWTEASA